MLFLIMDAPTHGKSYYDIDKGDDYPQDDKLEVNLEHMSKWLSSNRIGLTVFKCTDELEKMVKIISQNYDSEELKLESYSLKDGRKMEPKKLGEIFSKSCTDSMTHHHAGRTRSWGKGRTPRQVMTMSSWAPSAMTFDVPFTMHIMECQPFEFKENQKPIIEGKAIPMVRDKSYKMSGNVIGLGTFRKCYQIWDSDGKYIAKVPVSDQKKGSSAIWGMQDELKLTTIGEYFAMKFSEKLQCLVSFLPSYIFELSEANLRKFPLFKGNKFIIAEKFLEGKYVKYNNNNGWVNEESPESKLMQAFSHFTYHESKGWLMIVDLQGALSPEGRIMLTDPAAHSCIPAMAFGETNNGIRGMADFFLTHKCSQFCEKLGLPHVKLEPAMAPGDAEFEKYHPDLVKRVSDVIPKKVEPMKEGDKTSGQPIDKEGLRKKEDIKITFMKQPIIEKDIREWLQKLKVDVDYFRISEISGKFYPSAFLVLKNPDHKQFYVAQCNGTPYGACCSEWMAIKDGPVPNKVPADVCAKFVTVEHLNKEKVDAWLKEIGCDFYKTRFRAESDRRLVFAEIELKDPATAAKLIAMPRLQFDKTIDVAFALPEKHRDVTAKFSSDKVDMDKVGLWL